MYVNIVKFPCRGIQFIFRIRYIYIPVIVISFLGNKTWVSIYSLSIDVVSKARIFSTWNKQGFSLSLAIVITIFAFQFEEKYNFIPHVFASIRSDGGKNKCSDILAGLNREKKNNRNFIFYFWFYYNNYNLRTSYVEYDKIFVYYIMMMIKLRRNRITRDKSTNHKKIINTS